MRTSTQPNVRARAADERQVIEGDFEELDLPQGTSALSTVSSQGLARTQTQYATAVRVQVPRDIDRVIERVEKEAKYAADDFLYSFSIGKGEKRTLVEGVSIDGAMILARNYGNCGVDVDIVQEGPQHWILKAVFVDLETGYTLPRLFRQRKSGAVHGKFDEDRKLDIAFQIAQSKAQRNVITKAMPSYLVAAAVTASKKAAAAKIEDLPKAIHDAVATFGKMNVTPEQLEAFIGVPRARWNATDIVRLRATYRAINERQTTVEQEFGQQEDEDSEDAPKVSTPDKPAPAPVPPSDTNMFTGEKEPAQAQAAATDAKPAEAPAAQAPAAAAPPAADAAPPAAEPAKAETAPKATKKKNDREPGEEG